MHQCTNIKKPRQLYNQLIFYILTLAWLHLCVFPGCIAGKEKADSKPLPRFNRHSVFWILASVGLTYYVDFFRVLLENEDIKR